MLRRRRKPCHTQTLVFCGFWYPAVRNTAITGQKLVTAMLLEVPLVLGRTAEGKVFAMRDSCPHRGYRCLMGGSTEKWWSAVTTGGDSMLAAGSALRFLRFESDKLKVERIFAGHYPCESGTDTFGFT